jgi:hypothetical protein
MDASRTHRGTPVNQRDPQFKLRLPAQLRDKIQLMAAQDRRSMNSEIIVLLERALPESQKAEAAVTASAQ